MAEEFADRTEQPTPKRLIEAREEGNVFQSRDLAAALFLAAVTLLLWRYALPGLEKCKALMAAWLESAAAPAETTGRPLGDVSEFLIASLGSVLPILLLFWLAAYLSVAMQVGWVFTGKPLQPDVSRLSLVKGVQRIFGLSGWIKVALDLLKVVLVSSVVAITLWQHKTELVTLAQLELSVAFRALGGLMLDLAWRVLSVLLVLGLLDLLYQKWKHTHDLRMTKQQVKDELKQTEGDPEVRRRRGRSRHSSAQRLTIQST